MKKEPISVVYLNLRLSVENVKYKIPSTSEFILTNFTPLKSQQPSFPAHIGFIRVLVIAQIRCGIQQLQIIQ